MGQRRSSRCQRAIKRSNQRQRKEGDFGEGNTDVDVRGKQTNLWQYVDSIYGRRSTTRRSNAVPDNYNGDSIIMGSPKHTTDKWSTPSRQPTQRSSGHHQETEDESGDAVSSSRRINTRNYYANNAWQERSTNQPKKFIRRRQHKGIHSVTASVLYMHTKFEADSSISS